MLMQKLKSEDDILDPNFRAKVIAEILGSENKNRKMRELRKYEIYKDKTRKWVIESLTKELAPETIAQMENRAANISVCRKIVNKLARCYVAGVSRKLPDDTSQESVDLLVDELDFNTVMRKAERFLQLFKNTMIQVYPEICETEEDGQKFEIETRVLPPFLYDVIEDPKDKEKAAIVILTEFVERNQFVEQTLQPGTDGRNNKGLIPQFDVGNKKDDIIADEPEDSGRGPKRTFIWWSKSYHFTTDQGGEIIPDLSPEDQANPILKLPFVNLADDQDGQFWAMGGEDLIEGSILVNVLLTDLFGISNAQGWGQMVIKGKNLPKIIQGGPHRAIMLEYDDGDPVPDVNFQSSNPPLDAWMRMVEQYVALLLSTNDLAPASVSGKLDANTFPSGIAMLIEQSEATAATEDKQKIFQDAEPEIWELVRAWHELYFDMGILEEDFAAIPKFPSADVGLHFQASKPVVSETEKIANLKARSDLGLASKLDLIKLDNPDLTDEEAETKLLGLLRDELSLPYQKKTIESEVMAEFGPIAMPGMAQGALNPLAGGSTPGTPNNALPGAPGASPNPADSGQPSPSSPSGNLDPNSPTPGSMPMDQAAVDAALQNVDQKLLAQMDQLMARADVISENIGVDPRVIDELIASEDQSKLDQAVIDLAISPENALQLMNLKQEHDALLAKMLEGPPNGA